MLHKLQETVQHTLTYHQNNSMAWWFVYLLTQLCHSYHEKLMFPPYRQHSDGFHGVRIFIRCLSKQTQMLSYQYLKV